MPASARPSQSESVSVLLFKGNLPARGLEVPLRWVSQFGLLLSIMAAVTLFSSYLAVRFYRASLQSQPARLYELENQLADLKNAYELLKSQQSSVAVAPVTAPEGAAQVQAPVVPVQVPAAPTPSQAQAPLPIVPAVAPELPAENWALALVSHLKKDTDQPSIKLQTPKFQWQGVTLKIKAAFQYVKNDGKLQQGKFMFVARGPDLIVSHPRSALHPKTKNILAERGETFSVARHRDVNAELGPIAQSVLPTEIHLLVFNKSGALILEQALSVPARPIEAIQTESPANPGPQP